MSTEISPTQFGKLVKPTRSNRDVGNKHIASEGSTYRINNSQQHKSENEPSHIRLRTDMNKKEMNFLVDTGADICLVKSGCLDSSTVLRDSYNNTLTGITGQPISPIGIYNARINIDGNNISHNFIVVREEFKLKAHIDGIIGRDFLKKYKSNINYDKNAVTLYIHSKQIEIPLESRDERSAKNQTINSEIIHTSVQPIVQNRKEAILEQIPLDINPTRFNEEKTFIRRVIDIFPDIFHVSGESLSCSNVEKHKHTLKENIPPIHIRQYRLAENHKNEVNKQTEKMLRDNIIRNSKSPWNSPLLVVPKKEDAQGNKKWRVVVDFRKLNEATVGDAFPIPNINDILDHTGHYKYFTSLDLASGYHQIPMDPADSEKTAFSTPTGHFEFIRMPFGLKGAPATFQRAMNRMLAGLQGSVCLVYLDDIIIFGKSLEEHFQNVSKVFERLREYNFKVQPEKCKF